MGSSDGQKSAACRGSADLSGYGRADMQAVTGVYRGRWVLSSGGRDRTDNKKGSTSNEVRGVRKSFNHKRHATGLRFSRSFQPSGIRNTIAPGNARLLPLGRARLLPSRTSVLSNQCSVIAKSTPISGGRGSRRAERHHQSQIGPSCPRSTRGDRIVTTFFGSAGASPSRRGEPADEQREQVAGQAGGSAGASPSQRGEPADEQREQAAGQAAQQELRPPEGARLQTNRGSKRPGRRAAQLELRPPKGVRRQTNRELSPAAAHMISR